MNRKNPVLEWIGKFQSVEESLASVRVAIVVHARSLERARGDDARSRMGQRILSAIATQPELASAFDRGLDKSLSIDDLDDFEIEALALFESGDWTLCSAWETLGRTRREIGLAERRTV